MTSTQLPGYRRDLPFGHCFGHFTILELLRHRPDNTRRVILHSRLAPERRALLRERCRELGVALADDAAATPLDAVRFRPPFTLALGPEWSGLPDEVLAAGTPIRIPQSALVESLNLAVAAGIALYRATRPARATTP